MSQQLVTCFTDLHDSTRLAETLGHDIYLPIQKEYLRVGRALSERVGGRYVKDIGDAHMVTFDDILQSIDFASQLQQYYRYPSSVRQLSLANVRQLTLGIRIGLFLGLVQPTSSDVFGSGVNQASRVEGKAEPGQVIVNKDLVDNIRKIWGADRTASYFQSIGEQTLKGIEGTLELFSFRWNQYAADYPESTQAGLVLDHLESARVDLLNVNSKRLADPGIIVWPVEPRQVVTAINRSQVEIIRLLCLLGWTLTVMIVDCGIQHTPNSPISDKQEGLTFYRKITRYLTQRGVEVEQCVYLSDFFNPLNEEYSKAQSHFRDIAVKLTLQDLLDINNKDYTQIVKDEIANAPALNSIQPALTIAATLCLVEKSQRKGIVVAGLDERIQWDHLLQHSGERIGAVMNPVLKVDQQHQAKHGRAAPNWSSLQSFTASMEVTNLAWWSFLAFAYLPAYPDSGVLFNGQVVRPSDWIDELQPPSGLTKADIARRVWPRVEPLL